MDIRDEIAALRKANTHLRIAFNNVSEEREFLREQIKAVRTAAQELIATCQMYEGQNNAKKVEEIRFTPEAVEVT